MDAAFIAESALRIGTGLFFACSGFNKIFNGKRHAALVQTLQEDKVPAIAVMQWWVPSWELAGGGLLAAGLNLAALPLLVIMAVAIFSEGKKRVSAYAPINAADTICDWLYLPEVVYALVLVNLLIY